MANWLAQLFGSRNQRLLSGYNKSVARTNALEESFKALSDEQLNGKTAEFRQRLAGDEDLQDLLPEAFAAVAGCATLGLRHFDCQLIGGWCCTRARSPGLHWRRQDWCAPAHLGLAAPGRCIVRSTNTWRSTTRTG